MSKYFLYEEFSEDKSFVVINPNFELLPLYHTRGSFNILPARLLNLSYAQYLRLCRDHVGALIVGKNHYYPYPLFKKTKEFFVFLRMLNKLTALALVNERIEILEKKIESSSLES